MDLMTSSIVAKTTTPISLSGDTMHDSDLQISAAFMANISREFIVKDCELVPLLSNHSVHCETILKNVGKLARATYAANMRLNFDALLEKGFSRDEAIRILSGK